MKVVVKGTVYLYNWSPTDGFVKSKVTIPEGLELEVSEPQVNANDSANFVVFGTAKIPNTNRIQAYALRSELGLVAEKA